MTTRMRALTTMTQHSFYSSDDSWFWPLPNHPGTDDRHHYHLFLFAFVIAVSTFSFLFVSFVSSCRPW